MKNKGLIATIVIMSAVIVTLIAVLLLIQMPSIVSLDSLKINNETETTTEDIIDTIESSETTITKENSNLLTEIKTYSSNKERININYPEVTGMNDKALQDKINERIKNNAVSIIKLYPISTALQKLNIDCEVKYINENYITILYSGRVVGLGNSGETKSSNNSNNKTNSADPYLDGFVDPLLGINNAYIPQQNNFNIPNQNYQQQTPTQTAQNTSPIITNSGRAISGQKSAVIPNNADLSKGAWNIGTVDEGPVPYEELRPTAATSESVVSGRSASNNPVNQNSNNLPIYGYTGTNTSASTIDQKIFYTNTIDLKNGRDISLKDFVTDFEKLAKYARSSDVEIVNINSSDRAEVRKYIRRTIQSTLTEHLRDFSDFRNENLSIWPKHFSYRDEEGNIFFTIKLSSKLGNYAIIKYSN